MPAPFAEALDVAGLSMKAVDEFDVTGMLVNVAATAASGVPVQAETVAGKDRQDSG